MVGGRVVTEPIDLSIERERRRKPARLPQWVIDILMSKTRKPNLMLSSEDFSSKEWHNTTLILKEDEW